MDDAAMGIFIAAIRRGAALEDAARSAGFTLGAFWKVRKRDAAFDEAVEEAMEVSNAPRFIAPGNGRRWQLRRPRRLRFVEWRREVFLAHFALTCDETAAAEAAGVSTSTVCRHRQRDPDFAEAHQRALELGYPRLEAEALRQRLEAQRRLREDIVPADGVPVDAPLEFDQALKLLQRYERKGGKVGVRTVGHGRCKRWTFEQAIEALDRQLDMLKIPIEGEGEGEGEDPIGGGGEAGAGESGP